MLRSLALEAEVERLLREERWELAVLVSQTLLELRVEAEMVEHFEIIAEPDLGEAALSCSPRTTSGTVECRRSSSA